MWAPSSFHAAMNGKQVVDSSQRAARMPRSGRLVVRATGTNILQKIGRVLKEKTQKDIERLTQV